MARKRSKHTRWPQYVSISKGRIVWRPYIGRDKGKSKFGPEIVLFRQTKVSDAQVWDEYNKIVNNGAHQGSVDWLIERFLSSEKFKRLATRTQSDYQKYRLSIVNRATREGRFGDVNLHAISVRTINTYLSTASAPVQANRQIAMLSSAWNWVAGEEIIPPQSHPWLSLEP